MKVFSLFTIAATGLLAWTIPASAHVLPIHNLADNSPNGTVSGNNDTATGGNDNNSTQVSTDLSKFNGTLAKKYNTSCTCPQLALSPAGPAALNANASCTLQTNGSSTQVLSHGLLTLLPNERQQRPKNRTNNKELWKNRDRDTGNDTSNRPQEYSFALLFSRLYIDSNDTSLDHRGNQSDHLPNLKQGVQMPQVDSGVKGNLFWSFFSSKNGSSPDDVAFVRTKHMISGDNRHDVPDVNMLLSTSQDLFDDASYNETAPSIPGIGRDFKDDYVKLDRCNATSGGGGNETQPSETSDGGGGGGQPEATSTSTDQSTQTTSTSEATSTATQEGGGDGGGNQGQPTGEGGNGGDNGQQPEATSTTDNGGDQQQPQPTETSNGGGGGDQQQPTDNNNGGGGDQQQPTETNNGGDGGDQQQPQPTETNGGDQQQQPNGGDQQQQGDGGQQ
ncbi:hypothetical protein BCR42DRAFT_405112 [Absidia repens]|uniref:Uncharacterized protein n=1 Tax=Absidia repens TaxID=90262 RepID=A0A1X2IX29_9FUNG|nr:hypothetical protein BCR42DRAFT_405112 [Absidia repens]